MFKSTAIAGFSGLGNLLFVYSKAYLASKAFNCPLYISIPFDWNRKKLYYNLLKIDAGIAMSLGGKYRLKSKREIHFTHQQYLDIFQNTGIYDYGLVLKEYCKQNNIKSGNLIASRCWDWFAIERAKNWVCSILMADSTTRKNLAEIGYLKNPRKIICGFHIRRGDMLRRNAEDTQKPGSWDNTYVVPLEWFMSLAQNCKKIFGNAVEFLLVSDGELQELEPFIREFRPITTFQLKGTNYSDMLALSQCDLLVCSRSTYSYWAAFLSQSPYILFSPCLRKNEDGFYFSKLPGSGKHTNFESRGYVFDPLESMPSELVDKLAQRINFRKIYESDVLRRGYLTSCNNI